MNKSCPHSRPVPSLREGSQPSVQLSSLAAFSIRLLIITGMLLMPPGMSSLVAAHAQPATSDYEAALARVGGAMGAIRALRGEIDATLFEADELAFELAFEDASTISDWVSENIAYQPYRGLLRGPDGTLMTGAGNSLDQAVLLARLLGDAGYTVRIGLGQLEEEQAQELLMQASAPVLSSDARQLLESSEEQLAALAELPGIEMKAFRSSLEQLLQPPNVNEDLYGEAAATAAQIVELVSANGVEMGSNVHAELLAEAQEYAWVEYRFSAAEEWQQAHPLMAEGFEAPRAREYLDGAVPAEMQHRLRIEVTIERKLGDELEVLPVMDSWERPAANAWGTVLTYTNVPNAMGSGEADLLSLLEASEFFIPQWNGNMAPGAQAFDLEGNVLTPDDASNAGAAVFKTVNEKVQSAVGALGAIGTSSAASDPQALTNQVIRYTLIAPGGEETSYRRVIFDRIGAQQRNQGGIEPVALTEEEAALALISEQRIMVFPGSPRPEYLLDQFLARFLETEPFLEYLVALVHSVEPEISLKEALSAASPLEHLITVRMFDAGMKVEQGQLDYRAEPSLLVYSNGFRGSNSNAVSYLSLDIVHNARRVVRLEGESFVPATAAAVRQGVWETVVEREIIGAQGEAWKATEVLKEAVAAGANLMVLKPGDDPHSLGFTGRAALNLEQDLERGYWAVAARPPDEAAEAAWWRVDPATGETLGITADGRGQAATEYAIKMADISSTFLFALNSFDQCKQKHSGNDAAELCCLLQAHVNNVAGLSLGGMVGSGFSVGLSSSVAGALASLTFTLTTGMAGVDYTGMGC